jgi:hypothetical protein
MTFISSRSGLEQVRQWDRFAHMQQLQLNWGYKHWEPKRQKLSHFWLFLWMHEPKLSWHPVSG